MPKRLDGAAIVAEIKREVAVEVRALVAQGIRPGLAAVLVGHVPASEIYVRNKVQTCADLGIFSDLITPPDTVTTGELLKLVAALNARDQSMRRARETLLGGATRAVLRDMTLPVLIAH